MSLGLIIVSIIAVLEAVVIIELVVKSKKDNKSDNGVRNDFLSVMSHEIRTPINAVIGMNEMILREAKEEEIKEYASNIAVSSQMLLSLINDILDYSKIDKGKMEIVNVDFRLKYILNDLINMLSPRAKAKGIDFI